MSENSLLSPFQPQAFGQKFEPHQVFPVATRGLDQCLMSLDKAGEASLQQIPGFSDSAGIKNSLPQLFLCLTLPQLLFGASLLLSLLAFLIFSAIIPNKTAEAKPDLLISSPSSLFFSPPILKPNAFKPDGFSSGLALCWCFDQQWGLHFSVTWFPKKV